MLKYEDYYAYIDAVALLVNVDTVTRHHDNESG